MTDQRGQLPPKGAPQQAKDLGKWVKLLAWMVGVFAQSFPAAAYFFQFAPPFFPPTGVFVSVIGIVVLFLSYHREEGGRNLPRRSLVCVLSAVGLLVVYGLLLAYCTVRAPADQTGARRQIGFYLFDWSLTQEARSTIAQLEVGDPPLEVRTPNDLMGIFGAWGEAGRTDEIWHLWSIILAGLLLVAVFVVAFGYWAYGLGTLIRYLDEHPIPASPSSSDG